jgi:large repetitive protein
VLSLFSRCRRKPAGSAPPRTRLTLEFLETRDCPATTTAITTLSAAVLPGRMVQLTGQVASDNPAGVTLTFSGVMSGTTSPDASGHFSYTAQASALGTVSAVAVDQNNVSSDPATALVSTPAPALTLTVSYGTQHTVTLSGQVTDVDAGSLTVTFTGVVSGSVRTQSDGSFSYTAQASGLGNIQATTVDLWSQASNTAQVAVTNTAPVISGFTAVQGVNGYWTFSGTVTDEHPEGLVVRFGGLNSLTGQKATVQADGTFSITVQLAAGETGTASAQTTDWWGLDSNLALKYVSQ